MKHAGEERTYYYTIDNCRPIRFGTIHLAKPGKSITTRQAEIAARYGFWVVCEDCIGYATQDGKHLAHNLAHRDR